MPRKGKKKIQAMEDDPEVLQLQRSPKFLKILDPPLIFVLLIFIEIA